MKTRKPNEAQNIQLLQNEIHNRQMILNSLDKKLKAHGWTLADQEVANECKAFIAKGTLIVRKFYRPACE